MGIFGALFAGVSGLDAQSNKIGQISNNIANVNTVGFKEETAAFNTLVVPSGTTTFSPGGVISSNNQLVSKQGLIQATASGTDLAISGNGFFAVNTSAKPGAGQLLYTRVGSFTQDSSGNFVNANGLYLQGWLLSSTGAKPSNSTDPTTSLSTVKIQSNASGVAAPTTTVSISANLNASLLPTTQGGQPILLGAGETVNFDLSSTNNIGINAKTLIGSNEYAAGDANNIARGDTLVAITSSSGNTPTTSTFTYGGFAVGRKVTDSTSLGNGDSTTEDGNPAPAGVQSYFNQSNPFSFTGAGVAGPVTVTVAVPNTGLQANQTIDIEGVSAAGVGGLTAAQLNGKHTITAINAGPPTTATFTVTSSGATTTTVSGGGTGIGISALQPQSFINPTTPPFTTSASGPNAISVTAPNHGYQIGQLVDIEGATGTISNIPASAINGKRIITGISANSFTFNAAFPWTASGVSGGGTTVSFANRTYPFAGNILDASSPGGDLLGVTTTAPFDPTALIFNIGTTSNGTSSFKYVTGSADASKGQFNTLNTLADAINATTSLTARIVDGRLYVGAQDANQGLTFSNGQTADTPSGKGIDWVNELGLATVQAASATTGLKRFNSLNSLNTQVNTTSTVTASVANPLNASSISINASDPQATIIFTDGNNPVTGTGNTGSILTELGFKTIAGSKPVFSANPSTLYPSALGVTTGQFQALYSASDPNRNMSGGKVPAQFTRNITIYDSLGVSHTLAFNVAKTAVNTWSAELTSIPVTDLGASSRPDGQVATGTIKFNGDGSFSGVTGTISGFININWADGASTSSISMNLGTSSKTDGLSQFSAASNATLVNQDGSSAGQLTGVTIGADGLVTESFSNGQSHAVYKIPLVQVNNPNGLQAISGNAFKTSQNSGTALSVDAGTNGTGTIQSSSLEQSTVDLSSQLTNLIVAQQAYGANSKLLTVADQLLQQLDQIIR